MAHERSENENNLVFNEMLCFNEDEKLFNLTLVYKILIDFQFIIKLEETSQAFNCINSAIWNVI